MRKHWGLWRKSGETLRTGEKEGVKTLGMGRNIGNTLETGDEEAEKHWENLFLKITMSVTPKIVDPPKF